MATVDSRPYFSSPVKYPNGPQHDSDIQITVDTCGHLSPGADVKWIHRPEVKTSPQQSLIPAPPDVEMDQGAIWQSTTCKKGWYVSLASIINANLKASDGNVWTVPYGRGVGRIMKLGFQPVALAGQFYGDAVHPANTPAWTMRLQISFLFPKLTKERQEMLMEKKLKQFEQEPQWERGLPLCKRPSTC